jgi:hypothetical protein
MLRGIQVQLQDELHMRMYQLRLQEKEETVSKQVSGDKP